MPAGPDSAIDHCTDMNDLSTGDMLHAYLWGQIYGPIIALGIFLVITIIVGTIHNNTQEKK